jgi:hypothetical protein
METGLIAFYSEHIARDFYSDALQIGFQGGCRTLIE